MIDLDTTFVRHEANDLSSPASVSAPWLACLCQNAIALPGKRILMETLPART